MEANIENVIIVQKELRLFIAMICKFRYLFGDMSICEIGEARKSGKE